MQELKKLSQIEAELILKAPLLVCILIAGADDDIDRKEISRAIQLTQQKQYKVKSKLVEYYRVMAEDFEDKLKVLIQSYPAKAAQRSPMITVELQGLNSTFSKIDRTLAIDFYTSLREIAQKVAESSGGILGLRSVGDKEALYVKLPMLQDPSAS